MDNIKIEQLKVFAYHGCNEEEKINGQDFYVNATLYCDVTKPGESDALDDTVNYSKVCKFINRFLTENRFNLIEAAAKQTTDALLKQFPKVNGVDFTLYKPNAPIKLPFGNISVSVSRKWNIAYLSIGSNMGDREKYLNFAIDSLYDDDNCRVMAVSNFVQTEPYGPVEQEDFLNGCVRVDTLYTPDELLKKIHVIEAEGDRVRDVRWGPRTLDIDIIFYNDEIIMQQDLMIPHIEMHKRLFVLEPLVQIAPYVVHPIYRKTAGQLLEELKPDSRCKGCSGCAMSDKEQ